MPHIEVLPNTSSHAAPGWAYVVDTGYSSTNAAPQPPGVRKRSVRDLGAGRADGSSRQNIAISRHLAELDRENHKEVHIPVPAKQKDGAARCVYIISSSILHCTLKFVCES
jgi:zinc finger HIT domain-containing protein 1